MILSMQDGAIVALVRGKTIRIQAVTDHGTYLALLAFQVRPIVAVALVRGLITIKEGTAWH